VTWAVAAPGLAILAAGFAVMVLILLFDLGSRRRDKRATSAIREWMPSDEVFDVHSSDITLLDELDDEKTPLCEIDPLVLSALRDR